jgi:hemoglobin
LIARNLLFITLCLSNSRAIADDSLYNNLGGQTGIDRIVHNLLLKVTHDPRVADKFDNINIDYLEHRFGLRLCAWTGGPCQIRGASMKGIHAEIGLTDRHFNAVVEDLEAAMNEAGTPYRVQNRLLALLAPMHRDIVSQ